jgi:hypothetical protein
MLRLDDLIGKKILIAPTTAFAAKDKPGTSYTVTLHGVETGGVWIESPLLERIARSLAPRQKKPVFFVPYAQIDFLIAFSLELDEKSLGA